MNTTIQPRNILCIRLDSLGDVLMTEPALRALHETYPDCRLTLLTSGSGAQAAHMIRYLYEIIPYEAPWMHRRETADIAYDFTIIEHLRSKDFDAAIIFTVYTQNPLPAAMLCYLAGIRDRHAFCREHPYQLVNYWVPEQEPKLERHEVERQLALVAGLGATLKHDAIHIDIPESARYKAKQYWQSLGSQSNYKIVVHPGATAAARRYPLQGFAEAMQLISEQIAVDFIVTGDGTELNLTAQLAQTDVTLLLLGGQLSTEEWAAVIETADLLISNNTGAVHIAAATGTPVVDIYALTNPQHTPWRVPARVLSFDVPCKHCYTTVCPEQHHRCLLEISPEEVANAALELLADTYQSELMINAL